MINTYKKTRLILAKWKKDNMKKSQSHLKTLLAEPLEEFKKLIDSGFLPGEAFSSLYGPLINMAQIMIDPENDPPQYTKAEAWELIMNLVPRSPSTEENWNENS